ncbi:MAG: DinB family protein [Chloroflexi bacterium]|nr:DinB family protein [Chloroflexota bacterium]
MTAIRTLASWVEPVASRMRESRARVLEYARTVPEDAWASPSPLEGWSCKDVLAHIGKANDGMFQAILREIIVGRHLDRSIFAVDTDGDNERLVEERRERPVSEIIAELEEAGDEVQELLSQLTGEAEDYRQDDPPFILSGFMRLVHDEDHDGEHLAQIRAVLEK